MAFNIYNRTVNPAFGGAATKPGMRVNNNQSPMNSLGIGGMQGNNGASSTQRNFGVPGWFGQNPFDASKGVSGTAATTQRGTPGAQAGTGDAGAARGIGDNANPYGSESGPGILEQWFNQRANGTDPGYEYAMNRGMNDIGSRMASAGSFNSGATAQQQSDFAANMAAQREGQLDALAGGASGEHQGRLNAMINQMMGLAGGQSGLMGAYDTASANAQGQGLNALIQMMGGQAGVDSQANQSLVNNILGGASVLKMK